MINESDIVASKLLRSAYAIGKKNSIANENMGILMALLTGIFCLHKQQDERNEKFAYYTRGNVGKLFGRELSPNSEELGKLFSDVLSAVADFLDSKERSISPQLSSSRLIFEAIETIYTFTEDEQIVTNSDLERVFYYVFKRAVGQQYEREFRNSFRFSELAKALLGDSAPIWEYFLCFGDLSASQTEHSQSVTYGSILPAHELLLRLRLWIAGAFLRLASRDDAPSHAFLYINHPQYSTTGVGDMAQDILEPNSALSALARLWRGHRGGQAIAVIPGVDRSAGGPRGRLREDLISMGAVEAIIDLPLQVAKGQRPISTSVWVLGPMNPNRDVVLCIDAAKLPKRDFSFDVDGQAADVMKLLGAIVNVWRNSTSSPHIRAELESNALSGLFSQHFKQGYRDVPDLCRVVHRQQIRDRKFVLSAKTYVQANKGETVPLSSIDGSAILSMLENDEAASFRAYIIGNNGTGKSWLLRELVHRLEQKQIRSVGIAFGITDRFPFLQKTAKNSMFVYRGARTTSGALNLSTAISALARLTKQVHIDQPRLDVFNATMGMLGFDRRHYLVPQYFSSSAHPSDEQLAEMILLTDSAQQNENMFSNASELQYQLGLMRRGESGNVVFLDALSSGEQQVLTLVIKLIAEAQPGTVMLVDEPEISMHVAWQRVLPTVLEHISTKLNCSMVIATHSPVLIASATATSDFSFVAREGSLTPVAPKRVQSVDTVLFDDFETYTENNRRVHERCAKTVSDVITLLSSNDDDRMAKVKQVREDLAKMENIIQMSSNYISRVQFAADIDLIRKADLAIGEIIQSAHLESLQDEESE